MSGLNKVVEVINCQNRKIQMLISENARANENIKILQRTLDNNERNYSASIKR